MIVLWKHDDFLCKVQPQLRYNAYPWERLWGALIFYALMLVWLADGFLEAGGEGGNEFCVWWGVKVGNKAKYSVMRDTLATPRVPLPYTHSYVRKFQNEHNHRYTWQLPPPTTLLSPPCTSIPRCARVLAPPIPPPRSPRKLPTIMSL